MTKSRLEAFSDGVFAIAITLLVIDLRPPQLGPGERLANALWQQWPSYVAYLVSFLTIGVVWLNHHWILEQVIQVDGPLLVLNLNVLLWTALLPFPTAVLAEHLGAGGEAARTAAAFYSGVLALLALASTALFAWILHDDQLHRLPPAAVGAIRRQFLVGLAVYGVAFVLSWVWAPLGLAVCGVMALNHGRHHLRRRPSADVGRRVRRVRRPDPGRGRLPVHTGEHRHHPGGPRRHRRCAGRVVLGPVTGSIGAGRHGRDPRPGREGGITRRPSAGLIALVVVGGLPAPGANEVAAGRCGHGPEDRAL